MTNTAPPSPPSPLRRLAPYIWIGCLVLAGAIVLAVMLREPPKPATAVNSAGQASVAGERECNVGRFDKIGGPIDLIDETGAPATPATFANRPTLLYFGFANCPDICPMSLTTLGAALEQRPAGAAAINTALVSLDPKRDTPQALARYVVSGGFPGGLKGLTGTEEAVKAAAAAFSVYRAEVALPDSAMGYVIDHSSYFYLMDVEWRTVAIFSSKLAPGDMASCIDRGLAAAKTSS